MVMLGADTAFMSRMVSAELGEARSDAGIEPIEVHKDYT